MIRQKWRSRYMGASDTDKVVGNWKTKTWVHWWDEKSGLVLPSTYQSRAMLAGTFKEHQILKHIGSEEMDKQIIIEPLRLRVNLDGNTGKHIDEVKTHSIDKEFKVSKTYWRQCQTEMFAMESDDLTIVSYALVPDDYDNYYLDIDPARLQVHKIERDDTFIDTLLVPRLGVLSECLRKGRYPQEVIEWLKTA